MSTEIYYFSGSGNSLHVARELQKRIPETRLIPIVSLLSKDIVKTNAETLGFVFPIHGMTLPVPVKKFIEKLEVSSAKYLFAIATRGGTIHNGFTIIDNILKKKGKGLDSYFSITVLSNDPKLEAWKCPTKEEVEEMGITIQTRVDGIQNIVQNNEVSRENDLDGVSISHNPFLNFMFEKIIHLAMKYLVEIKGVNNYFYADEKCIGCGTCEKVCLSKKIKLVGKKPVWQNNVKCYFCYACLNYCPRKAVQIKDKWYMKSHTQTKGRYPHPFATADEIAKQKMK